ncbi:MAG: hypothetical protein ACR2J7_08445 [Luteimonas sp.]
MNRKLHNTLLALSTTGLALMVGLMVATPVDAPVAQATGTANALVGIVSLAPPTAAIAARAQARTARLEAKTRRFESEMRQLDGSGAAIARTASFVADIATEAALAAAIAKLEAAADDAAGNEASPPDRSPRRSRARNAFATPYFSFAHGLRQGNGA